MEKGRIVVVVIILSIIALSLAWMNPLVSAHLETPINSGWASTPPVVDGNMTSGEWANATVRDFTLNMRARTDGSLNRTLNARLYAENDWANLYLAVQIFNDDYEASDFSSYYKGLAVLFDNNHTGVMSVGDNGEGVTTYAYSPFYSANDLYYSGTWDADVHAGKTNDGNMAWNHTDPVQWHMGNWTFEMRIPLVGSDPGYDFNITSLPWTVGYKVWFQDVHWQNDGVYPDDPSINRNFDETINASTYGNLIIHPLYTLTMITTTGGTTNPSPGVHQYPYKTVVSATATADPWYQFDHWELDSVNVGSANPYSVTMDQNHTLKAVFIPLYALTIVTTTGGTTSPAPGMHVYPSGTTVPVTATNNSGYEFDHWELDTVDVGTSNPYSVLMNQNHTLKAVFVPQLLVSISPAVSTINLGGSVAFVSVVTGGTPPYSYQWYLNLGKVAGAVSSSWTFTPTSVGTYYVYLNVTDSRGRVAISNTARVIVVIPPVGGYSVSLKKTTSTPLIVCYGALIAAFGAGISLSRRKKK